MIAEETIYRYNRLVCGVEFVYCGAYDMQLSYCTNQGDYGHSQRSNSHVLASDKGQGEELVAFL